MGESSQAFMSVDFVPVNWLLDNPEILCQDGPLQNDAIGIDRIDACSQGQSPLRGFFIFLNDCTL
jgi:hypothetical protein